MLLVIILLSILSIATSVEEVTIKARDYCYGCMSTVNLYSTLTSNRLRDMQTNRVASGEKVEANDIAKLMCDDQSLVPYKTYIKYSCIKIMDEYRNEFLRYFEGDYVNNPSWYLFLIRVIYVCRYSKLSGNSIKIWNS